MMGNGGRERGGRRRSEEKEKVLMRMSPHSFPIPDRPKLAQLIKNSVWPFSAATAALTPRARPVALKWRSDERGRVDDNNARVGPIEGDSQHVVSKEAGNGFKERETAANRRHEAHKVANIGANINHLKKG